jgi:hypothetical protein
LYEELLKEQLIGGTGGEIFLIMSKRLIEITSVQNK